MTPQAEIVRFQPAPTSPLTGDELLRAALEELQALREENRRILALLEKNESPLYVTAEKAAALSGFGKDVIKERLAWRRDPLPHIVVGNRKYVEVAGIAPHFKKYQLGN